LLFIEFQITTGDIMPEKTTHVSVIIIAIAVVISAVVLGDAIRGIKRAGDTIVVTGSARRPIRSDFIVWRGSVSSQKASMQDAYQEVKRHSDRVRSYLKDHRVPENTVTFGSIETEPIQEWLPSGHPSGKTIAYRLTQRFEVRSNQVDSIASLSSQATDLINEGISLNSFPPEFLFTKLAELRVEMMAEATKDARLRAEKIAESAGSKIGTVRSARMGVFQITPRNSTEISDYGMNDTSSLEKDITAVVSLSFAVK
jgi:uncharacterized protein